MTENFEFNKNRYINFADKIKLSDTQKNILISQMENANSTLNETDKSEKKINTYYNIWLRVVASVLAFTVIGAAMYFLGDFGQRENSFMITASAAEIELGTSEIKLASGEIVTNFSMRIFSDESVEPYLNEYGKQDLFQSFVITELTIEGENIESVTFDTNKNSTYFNIYTDNYNNEFEDIQPLTHSQYAVEEFEKHYDGFSGYVCDGFTCQNIYDSKEINLDNKISLMIESDYDDGEISEWMNIVSECIEKREKYQQMYAPEDKINGSHFVTEEEIANDEKTEEYVEKIVQKTLDGATIDITVKFTDGTKQTKTLVLGYDNSGEESFLTAKTA